MKTIKRNAVIVTVMLFICAAVYLNWSYNNKVDKAAEAGGKSQEVIGGQDGDKTDGDKTDGGGTENLGSVTDEGDAGLYYTVNSGTGADGQGTDGDTAVSASGQYGEYFARARMERAEARDRAAATLSTVAGSDGASPETVNMALSSMAQLAERAVQESEIESLVRAKGFIDCVVYISDQGVKVTVAREGGLDAASVAQITDIIVAQTGLTPDKLTVTEVK